MNTKHTPKPWIATVQPGQVVGVHTYTHQVMCGDDCIASLLTEADAHLIAAAPDLLEGLRSLLAAYESILPGVRHIAVQDYQLLNDAPCAARAAIAKAEGGRQ